jgi:hypothetical protein
MKFSPLFFALGLGMNAWAADTAAGKGSADTAPSAEEIQTIRKILELPPERLSRIRGAIEHIEKMPPGARKEFADKLAKFETASPEERRKLTKELRERGGFSGRVLEHYFKSLPPDKVKEERTRINGLTPEQRQEFIRQQAERFSVELAKEGEKKSGGEKKAIKRPKGEDPRPEGPAVASPVVQ